MRTKIVMTLLVIILNVSCNKNKVNEDDSNELKLEDRKELVETKEVEKSFYCFRKAFGAESSTTRDVLEMNLEITNHLVEGSYNWLPAEKDKRLGNISAILENGIVTGSYISMQEGVRDSTAISFELLDKEIRFITDPLSISPSEKELPRSDCR